MSIKNRKESFIQTFFQTEKNMQLNQRIQFISGALIVNSRYITYRLEKSPL